jgi:hypothetical protein
MSSDPNALIQRLKACAEVMRADPIQTALANEPDPCRLPKCHSASVQLTPLMGLLILDTQSGQRILVEMSAETFERLHGAMSIALAKPV